MRKKDFQNQLAAASFNALRLGQEYLKNRLSTHLYYVIILNELCNEDYNGEEKLYPEDERKIFLCATESLVVDILFRDGRCPQRINIAVAGSAKYQTLLCLNCSSRYLSDEGQMQCYDRGTQPFGINPPIPPENWTEGKPLKIKKRYGNLQILGAIITAQTNSIVIDRNMRRLLAERLRQYLSGQICNYDLADLGIGFLEYDIGVRDIQWLAWHFYDDLYEHKAVGKNTIPDEVRHVLVRCICFLHTDYECSKEDTSDVDLSEWVVNGIYWPFVSQEQYETAMQNPKLMSANDRKTAVQNSAPTRNTPAKSRDG